MSDFKSQLDRMKSMMNYRPNAEKNTYSTIEYKREGADGKMYGIVREGTKFYIKTAPKKANLLKEDFEYIGGFRNRKDNEYSSYANAVKQFDLKMTSIKEACNKKDVITESWNIDTNAEWSTQSTENMRSEIMRQRQIMENVMKINNTPRYEHSLMEDKPTGPNTDMKNDPFQEKSGNKEADNSQNSNMSKSKGDSEAPKGKRGDEGYTKVKVDNSVASQCPKGGKVVKEEEVLGWNDNEGYLDKTHGTEIGDSAPFNKKANNGKDNHASHEGDNGEGAENGTVVESHGKAMHKEGENQNTPKPGVGEIGDDGPFTEKVTEEEEKEESKEDETLEEAISDFGGDETEDDVPFGDDDFSQLDDEMSSDDETSLDQEMGDDSMEARLSSLEDMIAKIAAKLGVEGTEEETFADDSLYDGEEGEGEIGGEEEIEEPIEDSRMYEGKDKMKILEDRLNDFGKHPAYQKKVMELPPANHKEKEGYYDMNDDSVKNEKPFGNEIGDSAPFEIDPEAIKNAIAESIIKILSAKKKKR